MSLIDALAQPAIFVNSAGKAVLGGARRASDSYGRLMRSEDAGAYDLSKLPTGAQVRAAAGKYIREDVPQVLREQAFSKRAIVKGAKIAGLTAAIYASLC